MGDTGLWFVPTGEVLPARRWSLSAYRVNFDFSQGFTDVSDFPVTFGVGLGDRAEIFGAWSLIRRIDRDVRPIFLSDQTEPGGLVNDYPFVAQGWSDNQLGDFWVGGKVNLLSEYRQNPMAFAVRGMMKLPFAKDDEEGVGTGELDFALDAILSKEVNQRVELSGYGGFMFRGSPDDVELSNGFRWGFGAGFPTRQNLRLTAELHGESYFDDTVIYSGTTLVGDDLSVPPAISQNGSPVNASIGLTWIGSNGMFAGAGINWDSASTPETTSPASRAKRATRWGSSSGWDITRVFASTCRHHHRHRHRLRRRHRRRTGRRRPWLVASRARWRSDGRQP